MEEANLNFFYDGFITRIDPSPVQLKLYCNREVDVSKPCLVQKIDFF